MKLTERQAIEALTASGRDWKPVPGHGEGCIEAKGFHIRSTISPDADGMFSTADIEAFIKRDAPRPHRLSRELEAAWARVEAGADPADELGGFVLTRSEEAEIDRRCCLLADKLETEAAHAIGEADALHAEYIKRNVERVEENVTYLRSAK